jgi:hypothetical protein
MTAISRLDADLVAFEGVLVCMCFAFFFIVSLHTFVGGLSLSCLGIKIKYLVYCLHSYQIIIYFPSLACLFFSFLFFTFVCSLSLSLSILADIAKNGELSDIFYKDVVLPTVASHAAINRASDPDSSNKRREDEGGGMSSLRSEWSTASSSQPLALTNNDHQHQDHPSSSSTKQQRQTPGSSLSLGPGGGHGQTVPIDPSDEEAFLRFAEVKIGEGVALFKQVLLFHPFFLCLCDFYLVSPHRFTSNVHTYKFCFRVSSCYLFL